MLHLRQMLALRAVDYALRRYAWCLFSVSPWAQDTLKQAIPQKIDLYPAQMPEILHRAMRTAIGRQGVAVLVIPGDVAMQTVPEGRKPDWPKLEKPRLVPADADLDRLVALLKDEPAVTLMCGSGCAGVHDEVVQLADTLAAPVVHALRGKEYVEWDNPFDVGMTGLIGFSSGWSSLGALPRSAIAN